MFRPLLIIVLDSAGNSCDINAEIHEGKKEMAGPAHLETSHGILIRVVRGNNIILIFDRQYCDTTKPDIRPGDVL